MPALSKKLALNRGMSVELTSRRDMQEVLWNIRKEVYPQSEEIAPLATGHIDFLFALDCLSSRLEAVSLALCGFPESTMVIEIHASPKNLPEDSPESTVNFEKVPDSNIVTITDAAALFSNSALVSLPALNVEFLHKEESYRDQFNELMSAIADKLGINPETIGDKLNALLHSFKSKRDRIMIFEVPAERE